MVRVLILTDKKKSSENQANALFNNLKYQSRKKLYKETKVILREYFHFLPNRIIYFILKIKSLFFPNKKCKYSLIISCGRITAPYSLILKQESSNARNIHILNPYLNSESFDTVILPNHDKKKASRTVLNSIGILADKNKLNFTKLQSSKLEKVLDLQKKKIITILIGGSGKSSTMSVNDIKPVFDVITGLKNKYKVIFLFSRRTPVIIKKFIINKKRSVDSFYPQNDLNPYWFLLNRSDSILVTADSISMTSEALLTGKPIIIIPIKKIKEKIKNFHFELKKRGLIKFLQKDIILWKNNSLDESKRIACLVKKKIGIF